MQPKATHLLLLVIGTALAACASISEQGGSGIKTTPEINTESDMPRYPWPPEAPSSRIKIDRMFKPPLKEGMSLFDVSERLSDALADAGYDEKSYYSAPGGFAMVTRLEATDKKGASLGDEERYLLPAEERDFGFVEFIRNLFFAPEGYYRFIVFIVTDVSFAASEKELEESEALDRLMRGFSGLPDEYRSIPFSSRHRVEALIYEFRKGAGDQDVEKLLPGRLPPQLHITNSGLGPALDRPSR